VGEGVTLQHRSLPLRGVGGRPPDCRPAEADSDAGVGAADGFHDPRMSTADAALLSRRPQQWTSAGLSKPHGSQSTLRLRKRRTIEFGIPVMHRGSERR
jgi:hypothetical protein